MGERAYDLLVVGGGIVGACIARDAALRGLKVALVEQGDFSGATSSATSKLVHGGLRYLKNLEFGLIRESLSERRVWERIAPHMVRPLPFLLPLYGEAASGMLKLQAGLTLYDLLAFDKGWLPDPDKRIPNHSWLNRTKAVDLEPALAAPGLAGAFLYYDCQTYAPERLGLECVVDAVRHGADAANYASVETLVRDEHGVAGAEVRDVLSGASHVLRARMTVNAAGPWADHLLGMAQGGKTARAIRRSKGIHVIVRALTKKHALTVQTASGGHFFVLPWRGYSIVGTTDTPFEGAPGAESVTEGDIHGLLAEVNAGFPAAKLVRGDVLHHYVGLRPLVDDGSKESKQGTYGASRRAEIVDHEAEDKLPGLISAIGGKWTTARHIAERAVNLAAKRLHLHVPRCATASAPLPGAPSARFREFAADVKRDYAGLPQDVMRHLAQAYGARMRDVMALAQSMEGGADRITSARPNIAAEIAFAVREEMAMTLQDVVFRRLGFGNLGLPAPEAVARAGALTARELGWPPEVERRQVEETLARFRTAPEEAAA